MTIPSRLVTPTQKIVVRFILPLLILAPALVWNASIHNIATKGAVTQKGGIEVANPALQVKSIANHPIRFVKILLSNIAESQWYAQSLGLLGHNFVIVKDFVLYLETTLLVLAIFLKSNMPEKRRSGLISIALGICTILSIIVTLYLVYNPVGSKIIDGVQGRYFLPILPFIFYGIAVILPIRIEMPVWFQKVLFPSVSGFGLLSALFFYIGRTG